MDFKRITFLLLLAVYSNAHSNDDFLNAVALQGPFDQEFGDTVGSTQEAGEPTSTSLTRSGGIWYRYTTGPSIYDLSVSLEVLNTGRYDHILDAFQALGGGSIFELAFLGYSYVNDGEVETVRFVGSPNTTYYFRVSRYSNDSGSPVEITLSSIARPRTTPAALKATARNALKKAIKKSTSNLRAAQRRGNASSAAKIRQNIKKLKRQLRRV